MNTLQEYSVPSYAETLDNVYGRLCSELDVANNPVDEEIVKNIICEYWMGGITDEEQLYISSLEYLTQ